MVPRQHSTVLSAESAGALPTVACVLQRLCCEVGIKEDERGSMDVRREGGDQGGGKVKLLEGTGETRGTDGQTDR